VKIFNVLIYVFYEIGITMLGIFAYRAAYWPTIIGAILVYIIVCFNNILSAKYLLTNYLILCLLIMISSIISGIFAYNKTGNPFRYIFDDFLESQFWVFLYFYAPLFMICFIVAFVLKSFNKQ